ncbi:MAG TPA: histidine phosphatase family protein [Lacibacter sp.]|nr:histidine phosphatase family protein [Lacibacter sp.]HMO90498.1 histidine phosphatase family protein [Lacibacter sp.]HMP86597.1 histidine phosphatase family protein [Lacibacter sp.]
MKTLLLVRHAKSSWSDAATSDFDRPLNHRGEQDAPRMARRLAESGIRPRLLLTSPALRARTTAELFQQELGQKLPLRSDSRLYLASAGTLAEVVAGLDAPEDVVAVFTHNPGITHYANELTAVRIDNLPTCAIFAVQAEVASWKAFAKAKKRFLFFDYPKNPEAPVK